MIPKEPKHIYTKLPVAEPGKHVVHFDIASSPTSHQPQPRCHRQKFGIGLCVVASVAAMALIGDHYHKHLESIDAVVPFLADHSPESDPDPSAPWPRMAWLMSFPNSGTSFTMRMAGRVSNLTTATNYGKECQQDDGLNVPLFDDSPGGPYLLSPYKREVPDRYVMAKTHCGGRCTACGPNKYVETAESFLDACLTGGHFEPTAVGGGKKTKPKFVNSKYDAKLVQRAIHLIRDPFDNVVSRFHLEQHEKKKSNNTEWMASYPNTAEGFQRWCGYLDGRQRKEEKNSDAIDDTVLGLFKRIPCHGDFYRYTQWHNLALDVVQTLDVPTLVVHYENYEKNYAGTVDAIFSFLDLPRNGELPDFIAGKRYEMEFFTVDQRHAAMELMRYLADDEAWQLLERYDTVSSRGRPQ